MSCLDVNAWYLTNMLHNIDTNVAVVNTIKTRFLKTLENGEKTYQAYRNERFVEKSAKLATTIHNLHDESTCHILIHNPPQV